MTDRSNDRKDRSRAPRDAVLRLFSGEGAALRRLRLRACLSIGFERFWPLILPLILLVGLFASLSWFGLFGMMPRWLHIGVLALFGLAGLIALCLPFRFSPRRKVTLQAASKRSMVLFTNRLPSRQATWQPENTIRSLSPCGGNTSAAWRTG